MDSPITTRNPHDCSHESDINILRSAVLEMKETLKYITDLLMSNAVLEEQVAALHTSKHALEERLHNVELEIAQQKGSARWVERVVWLFITAGLTGLLTWQAGGKP